ncbi:MAG: hypothetical protein BGO12_08815 [Verrucomicrobia bacterium 61-8]|nr:AEC family transporter [Verrucomicrobiota bacterium]OJV17107.1 MAG: hypothetical protein BGO12_08815 [Verrucomicrobia bacterium 61-8]
MHAVIFETLAPLVLIIALGTVLAKIKFLGHDFMNDLNKLAFWVALPALLFTSASHAIEPGGQLIRLMGVLWAATILIIVIAWLLAIPLGVPHIYRGTFSQSAFRGNSAYIALPVLAYSVATQPFPGSKAMMATAVIAMILLMASYNIFAVIVLQVSRHEGKVHWMQLAKPILRNPLLLAGILGILVPILDVPIPGVVDRAFKALGDAAVPLALLCIGGSLAHASFQGKRSAIVAAALLKVVVLPIIVYVMCRVVGLGLPEQRIAMVLAAAPTAAAAFVMAKEMGGDPTLASGSIALSTILSAASLAVALYVTS